MHTPAKINLYLEVTGIRPDGYHELRTLFLPIHSLTDEITITKTGVPGLSMACDGDFPLAADNDNLCMKAARKFAEHFSVSPCWHIRLTKHIPIAAGLGGGSSDAAAVLRILADMHGMKNHPDLPGIASRLGADIPFFLQDRPAVGTGIGDILTPLPQLKTPLNLLLVNPGFPLPVQWVYKHMYRPDNKSLPDFQGLLKNWDGTAPDNLIPYLWNDLEACVFDKFPILQLLRKSLLDAGASAVLLSGSGPTLFAVCRNNSTPIAEKIRTVFGDQMKLFPCQA